MEDEQGEGDAGDGGFDPDLGGLEPGLVVARSRNSWKAPIARLSRAKPVKSKGVLRSSALPWMKKNTPAPANRPSGRLM